LAPTFFLPNLLPNISTAGFRPPAPPIKTLLRDQTKFAGVGDIYANEALFLCQIHPLTPSNQISASQSRLLCRSLLATIRQSIKAGGSTARGYQYLRHNTALGRSAFLCPSCQKIPSF